MLSVFGFMIAAILQRIRYAAGLPDEYAPETQIIYIVYTFRYPLHPFRGSVFVGERRDLLFASSVFAPETRNVYVATYSSIITPRTVNYG